MTGSLWREIDCSRRSSAEDWAPLLRQASTPEDEGAAAAHESMREALKSAKQQIDEMEGRKIS